MHLHFPLVGALVFRAFRRQVQSIEAQLMRPNTIGKLFVLATRQKFWTQSQWDAFLSIAKSMDFSVVRKSQHEVHLLRSLSFWASGTS